MEKSFRVASVCDLVCFQIDKSKCYLMGDGQCGLV